TIGRAAFLVKESSLDSIGIAFQGEGPVFEMRQEGRRRADVIINDLGFGETNSGIKDFVEPGDRHRAPGDLQNTFSFAATFGFARGGSFLQMRTESSHAGARRSTLRKRIFGKPQRQLIQGKGSFLLFPEALNKCLGVNLD